MSALYWLMIPVGATLVAMLVATWVGRPRRSVEKYDQVEQFQKFREAMEDETVKRRSATADAKPITRTVE